MESSLEFSSMKTQKRFKLKGKGKCLKFYMTSRDILGGERTDRQTDGQISLYYRLTYFKIFKVK